MQFFRRHFAAFTLFIAALAGGAGSAFADTPLGQPRPWELGMQASAGPLKDHIIWLHDLVLVIITIITIFVAVLLAVVVTRFSRARNPVASTTSHHTLLEVAWTVLPVLILVIIAIPSFRLVYYEDRTHDADLTIKVTAHQWYWEYTYQDQGGIDVESRMIADDDLKPGQVRRLEVDNQLVVPVGKNIRLLTTSSDVIHSFFIPALGVQRYAIPGRTIETWMNVATPGVFYGECNQVCGEDHAKMPIAVRGVTPEEFAAWVAKNKTAAADPAHGSVRVASVGE